MTTDEVTFLAGEITGLALRAQTADFEAAAAHPDLTAENRRLICLVAAFRRQLDEALDRHEPRAAARPFEIG